MTTVQHLSYNYWNPQPQIFNSSLSVQSVSQHLTSWHYDAVCCALMYLSSDTSWQNRQNHIDYIWPAKWENEMPTRLADQKLQALDDWLPVIMSHFNGLLETILSLQPGLSLRQEESKGPITATKVRNGRVGKRNLGLPLRQKGFSYALVQICFPSPAMSDWFCNTNQNKLCCIRYNDISS